MNEELKKLGKNCAAELLYYSKRDGLSSKTLWEKCKNHNETITLVETDKNSVIGVYCSEKWEDTTKMKSSDGFEGCKDSGKTFLFYWIGN